MTKTQLNKKRFVEHELLYMLQHINPEITKGKYKVEESRLEIVTVYYDNGFKREINVSGDSLHALSLDVLNRI